MDYDDIAAHFLIPSGDEPPAPMTTSTVARRLRDAVEPIATIGWWSRSAADAAQSLGHGFFDGYVWGRSAALGADVATPVVVSAFGTFHPDFLGPVFEHARSVSTRADILEVRSRGAGDGLRAATIGIDMAVVVEAGDLLIDAVRNIEPGPRVLFAALQSLPIPDDSYGRLWRACELVREHRGDTHLAACASAGLDSAEMNVFTELWLGYTVGEYASTRGFGPDALRAATDGFRSRGWVDHDDTLTEAGRAARHAIEDATDLGQRALIDALGTDVERVIALTGQISTAVVRSFAAPADPRKRAAG